MCVSADIEAAMPNKRPLNHESPAFLIGSSQTSNLDYEHNIATLDVYLDELRESLYAPSNE
jgi:hypothetical protein